MATALPKMMIAFLVRRCAIDIGHEPTAEEFAAWSNHQGSPRRPYCLFGRPITEAEARAILKHRARLVTARSARPHEQYVEQNEVQGAADRSNVIILADIRVRASRRAAAQRLRLRSRAR
jgi:hypothetical protein